MKYKSLEKLKLKEKVHVKSKLFSFFNKILVCGVILLLGLIFSKSSPKMKEFMNEKIFNNNFSFAYIKDWYNKHFGSVLPVSNNNTVSVFNEKLKYSNKVKFMDGYKLTVDNNYLVPVLESGIVVYMGLKEGYGKVIIIEQIDGNNLWYGNVNSSYKLYDYVSKGDFLGETIDSNLYLVLEKGGKYLDIENIIS